MGYFVILVFNRVFLFSFSPSKVRIRNPSFNLYIFIFTLCSPVLFSRTSISFLHKSNAAIVTDHCSQPKFFLFLSKQALCYSNATNNKPQLTTNPSQNRNFKYVLHQLGFLIFFNQSSIGRTETGSQAFLCLTGQPVLDFPETSRPDVSILAFALFSCCFSFVLCFDLMVIWSSDLYCLGYTPCIL